MKKSELNSILKNIFNWLDESGKIIEHYHQNLSKLKYKFKGTDGIATEADLHVEEFLISKINKFYPGHTTVGEETFNKKTKTSSGWCWYIDPIDGTNNFARGIPFFCTAISVTYNDVPVIGVIHNPLLKEVYFAIKGQGAKLKSKNKVKSLIPLKKTKVIKEAIFSATTIPKLDSPAKERILKLNLATRDALAKRRLGSAALEICLVAAGNLDGYWGRNLKPWDIIGACLIASEAGMKVTDLFGRKLNVDSDSVLIVQPSISKKLSF